MIVAVIEMLGMATEVPPDKESAADIDRESPDYWIKAFKGTPMAIMVPPYIRFLQGIALLRKAEIFLHVAHGVARQGHPQLSTAYEALEQSKDTKRLGLTFETYFASYLTINLVSEVEHFFSSAISAALRMHPEKMGKQSFNLLEIMAASSTDELIDRAARGVLNDMIYARPNEYIKRLTEILSIEMTELQKDWPAFVELKARRDLGVHNNWVVNEIYLRKIQEVNIDNAYKLGDRVVPDFSYTNQSADICHQFIETMVNLLAEKWLKTKNE